MNRVVLKQARPGMALARALQDPHHPEAVLMDRGETLTPERIAELHERGVYDLWVQEAGMEFLDERLSHSLPPARQRLCQSIKAGFQVASARLPAGHMPGQMRDTLRVLVEKTATSTLPCFDALAHADEHISRHGAEVAYMAVLLGVTLQDYLMEQRKHGGRPQPQDYLNLGMGCLFHDIGDTKLEDSDREVRRVESNPSLAWRKHVELGFNVVRGQLEPSAAAIVLHHHQHFDGSGFPGMPEKGAPAAGQIHVFSRIAMVADTFCHFLSHDGVPMPAMHALWRLQHPTCKGWCDPVVLNALLRKVGPFLPGMVVQLSDRRYAVVTKTSDAAPCHPEVRTLATEPEVAPGRVLDLAAQEDVWVQRVDSIDVTSFIYCSRPGEVSEPRALARDKVSPVH